MNRTGIREALRASWLLVLTLWLVGVYLRLPMLAVPPVSPMIRASFGVNETWIGLLTTLPVLLFALVAIPGSWLISRLGLNRTLLVGLLLLGVGSALRGAAGGIWMLLGMTLLMGTGIALMQPAMPSLAGAWFPHRVGFATAVYSNGWLAGEIIAASLTLPLILPLAGGSWRLSFVLWSVPIVLVFALVAYLRPSAEPGIEGESPRRIEWRPNWRDRRIWVLGLMLGGSSALYFGTNAYLPDFLHATGRAELVSVALLLLNGTQLVSSVLLAMAARHVIARRAPFVFGCVLGLCALLAVILAPGRWILVGAAGVGFAASWLLILTLALPPVLTAPYNTHRLSASMFTIGYLCSFATALLGGVLWDATGVSCLAFVPPGLYVLAMVGLSLTLRLPGYGD